MESNKQSLREKLFGPLKALRTKIAEAADTVADAMPASTYTYTRPEKPAQSVLDTPVLKAGQFDAEPEIKVDNGALVPNKMNEKIVSPKPKTVPKNAVKIMAEDDMPEGAGQVERIGSELYQIPNKGTYTLKDRGVSLSQEEIERALKPMLYSEIAPHGTGAGQRPKEKVELEMRAIMNTVLNRSKNRKKPVTDIINEPNQYQGVGTPKYNNFGTTTDPLEKEQVDFINETMGKILSEIENGTFQDNVGGAEFYGHLKDGTIRAFDTWEEYKKAINAGLVK